MVPEPLHKFGGPVPKFNEYHLWKAVVSLDDKVPIGRKKLSAILGVGEGSTRTIISILTKKKYVTTGSDGVQLTEVGKRFKKLVHVDVSPLSVSGITIDTHNCAARVPHSSGKVNWGCEERDVAVRYGATGATTLVCTNGDIVFPDSGCCVSKEVDIKLRSLFGISDGDVIVIGTADNPNSAECGAVTAALNIVNYSKVNSACDNSTLVNVSNILLSLVFTVHNLVGKLPVCAKMKDGLGVRVEDGVIIDDAYSGEILEQVIETGKTIETTAYSGPYKNTRVIVSPIEVNGSTVAAIGVVNTEGSISKGLCATINMFPKRF
ncbi:MAG: DUF2111 domain-containing protein [archaeon]|nr:DUF2111 domain-containing protein [archaeon]